MPASLRLRIISACLFGGLLAAMMGLVNLGSNNIDYSANEPFPDGRQTTAVVVHKRKMPQTKTGPMRGGVKVVFESSDGARQESYVRRAYKPDFHVGQEIDISYRPGIYDFVRAPGRITSEYQHGDQKSRSMAAIRIGIICLVIAFLAGLMPSRGYGQRD